MKKKLSFLTGKQSSLVLMLVCLFVSMNLSGFSQSPFQNGADRLVAIQNPDGGWGWELTGPSEPNTIGPIAMGLAQAYLYTQDADHLAGLALAKSYLLAKSHNFSATDGYLAAVLDQIYGGTTCRDFVNANFYGPLAAGTYYRAGIPDVLYNTANWVTRVRTGRTGKYSNMAAWDVGTSLVGAAMCGASTAEWTAGTKAEINELDGDNNYDVIGLAGAVYGLAFVGEDFDPTVGEHAAASNINDLANILAGYQIAGGGFAWNQAWVIPNDGDEAIQETAYSILALNEVNRATYLANIQGAAAYMESVQLGTGGWINYNYIGTTSVENNEITGEALWGIAIAEMPVYNVTKNTLYHTIQAAIADANASDVINVAAGTYTEVGQIVIDKNLSIVGANKATTIIKPSQNTSNSDNARGWLLVNSGITFNLSNVTLDGTGKLIYMGIYYWGNGSVNNCIIRNIKYNESGPDYEGRGMIIKGNVNVTNCTFSQMGRIGIQYYGGSGIVSVNNITGKGDGSWYDYGVEIGAGAVVTIENNTVTGCTGLVSGDGSAAILATTYFGVGTTGTISNNILSGNVLGIAVGYDANDECTVFAHNNDLSNNSQYAILSAGNAVVDATCNWWGSIEPATIVSKISGSVTYDPWLNSGTDNEPGTAGFQPVPGSCGEIQWDGSESTSWDIPANWSGNTVPTASNNIIIPNVGFHPVVNIANAASSNLTIQSGAVLTIDPGKALTVSGTLATASAAGLVIASTATGTGSLIHHTANVQATINRYVTGSTSPYEYKYHLVSVPLAPTNLSYLGLFTGSYFYEYDPTSGWVNLGNLSLSTPLDETKGYMMYYDGDEHTYSFAGPINAGLFTANVVYGGTGFNLVPNPYPSAIDWDAPSGWTRTNIGNATWIWNAANYAAYVAGVGTNGGSQYIPVGQAFFVKANAASPALAMLDGVRVHNTQAFLKSGESIANLLRIRAEGNNYSDEAVIRFVDGATNGLDSRFDASKMYGTDGAPQLYTMALSNEKLSINSMPLSGAPAVTPLNLEMNANASCKFIFSGIESFLPGATLLLEDKLTATFTDLRKHSEYVFDHKAGNMSDRFNLHTSTMTGLGSAQADAGKIWLNEATLYIAAPKLAGKTARVELFNLLGQKLYETRITLNELTTLKPGVTGIGVVRVTCGTDVMTTKGILR